MTDSSPTVEIDSDKPRSPLAFLLRPIVIVPFTILVVIVTIPIVYRSTRFTGIVPIEEIVDREIEGRFIVEDDRNAFTLYASAVSMLPPPTKDLQIDEGSEAVRTGQGWAAISPEVRQYLEDSQGALAEWKLGTERDEAVNVEVATADFSALLPVTQELRAFGRLAVLQALRDLDEGKPDEAWQWLRALMRSSRHSGKHGFMVERFVGVALHRLAADSIAVWASNDKVTIEDLQKALTELQEIHRMTAKNSDSLKTEYIVLTNSISNARSLEDILGYGGDPLKSAYLFVHGEPQLVLIVIRHVFANYLSQCDLPPYERVSASTSLDLYLPTGKESPPLMDPGKLNDAAMKSVLARLLIPAVSQCITASDCEQALQTALELSIKLEMHRRKHGEYPETLEALIPEFLSEVPRDWMGSVPAEKMLLIRREAEPDEPSEEGGVEPTLHDLPSAGGLIIYSRGREKGDDGGMVEGQKDVGIRIPLPPGKAQPE
jgi:hypothetical protein